MHRFLRALTQPVTAFGLSLLVLAVLLAVSGYDVSDSLAGLWQGAFGSWAVFSSGTLVRATPLLFAGLAVIVAFRAGILNIGAEGQLLMGAVAATAAATHLSPRAALFGVIIALLAGMIAGAGWAAIAAQLRQRFGVLEVISTIMLNVIALQLTGFLVRGPLQEPTHTFPQSALIDSALRLPRLMSGSRLHAGFILAVGGALGLAWFLRATAAGFRLRVTGANSDAARIAGRIDTRKVTVRAFLVSGAIAGLGGAVQVTGVTFALFENLSPGYGYTAIAVALLARLNPGAAIAAAIVFGGLESGASAMQRDVGVPAGVVGVAEACVILVLLASEWLGDRAGKLRLLNRGGAPLAPSTALPTPT
jgi:general nucleoside transport system permease protein